MSGEDDKRTERVAVLAVALVIGTAVTILLLFAGALSGSLYFNVGANVIQWTSGPATFSAVVVAVYAYWTRRCAVPWCVRRGEHPVKGTLEKVCRRHHTRSGHELCHDLYAETHRLSDRLGFGESHDREET